MRAVKLIACLLMSLSAAAAAGCSPTTRPATTAAVAAKEQSKGGRFCDVMPRLGWPVTGAAVNDNTVLATDEHGEKHCGWKAPTN